MQLKNQRPNQAVEAAALDLDEFLHGVSLGSIARIMIFQYLIQSLVCQQP